MQKNNREMFFIFELLIFESISLYQKIFERKKKEFRKLIHGRKRRDQLERITKFDKYKISYSKTNDVAFMKRKEYSEMIT